MVDSAQQKRAAFVAMLKQTGLLICINTQMRGVRLPQHCYEKPTINLQFGYNLPVPIPDLQVFEDGLSATLSFNRTPYPCVIPWAAVFALLPDIEPERGVMWPADVPAIHGAPDNNVHAQPPASKVTPLKPARAPRFALAGSGAADTKVVNLNSYRRMKRAPVAQKPAG